MTNIDGIDTTIQKTNVWLKEIMEGLGWTDRNKAYIALRAVLHALRDRLPVDEAVNLGAQLPMLVRGIYYDQWRPHGRPIKYSRQGFLDFVQCQFNEPDIDSEKITHAVFSVLARKVAQGEIQDIKQMLPKPMRELWEEHVATPA